MYRFIINAVTLFSRVLLKFSKKQKKELNADENYYLNWF